MNSNSVACPLDCFDTCEAVFSDDKCKPSKEQGITNGKLCKNFAYLLGQDSLAMPSLEGNELFLNDALAHLKTTIQSCEPSKVLYYKGSGNLGVMQSAPKTFFDKFGATLTRGSLCDGVGAAGLENGRDGLNVNPPMQNLLDAEVVVVWGRNLTVTSSHMYEMIKDKTFITIDPIATPIAKKSAVHLQINPKTDHELALLMTRFAYMNDMEDEENFKVYADGHDWFFDLAKGRPLVSYESTTGVTLGDVDKAMDLMKDKKVAFLVGVGVQKYYEGAQIMRCIDSFAAYIGVHNKDAGGVWYLSDSAYGYEKQFKSNSKNKIDIATVDFGKFDVVFIQGANPVVTAPNSSKVIEGLKKSFVIYFGTTFNETCEYANLIIPSSSFLSKKDVRLSYGHEYKAISNAVKKPEENTISEYDLTQYLNDAFGIEALKSEDEIFDYYVNHEPDIPSEIEAFEFIEDLDIEALYESKSEDEYYLITAKQSDCLNSQFRVDSRVHLNPCLGFNEGDEVIITSENGQANFIVTLNEDVKSNCILIYSGAKNGNFLTPSQSDEEANSAIFQEVLVQIELS